MLIIPQWRTEQLLRQRLAELGGRVQRGTELTGLVQNAASVTATLVRAGVTERVRAGWLVGCEGGHSVIRKLLGVGFEDQTWEIEQMLVGDVEAEGLDSDHWYVWPLAWLGASVSETHPGSRLAQAPGIVMPDQHHAARMILLVARARP